MDKTIFEFKDYRGFFRQKTEDRAGTWGTKSKLAKAIGCQLPFISQFLSGKAELSSEQIFRAADFYSLSEEEKEFLILLHHQNRAGTSELKKYYGEKLEKIKQARLNISTRLGQDHALNEKERSLYYSSWIYAAMHMAVAIPGLNNRVRLRRVFKIGNKQFNEALKFLLETGLISESGGNFSVGLTRVRLGNDSAWIVKHHTNWRLRAIENLEKENINDLHYSGVLTLSDDDAKKIKDIMLENLKVKLDIADKSKEEKVYVLNFDLFNLFNE